MRRRFRNWKLFFLLPALFFLAIMFVYPIINVFWVSFYRTSIGVNMQFVGLANYQRLLSDQGFIQSLRITVLWTALSVASIMIISLALALLLNAKFALNRVVLGSLLIPWIIPKVIGAMDWAWIYNTLYGFLNETLLVLGLISQPLPWLGNQSYALLACLLAFLWAETPYFALIVLSGLKMISPVVYEASRLDGANSWQRFRYVTLPLLRPTLLASSTLATVWSFGGFVTVYALTLGGPVSATELLTIKIYETAFQYFSFGYADAMGVVVSLILAAFSIIYIQYVGRKID